MTMKILLTSILATLTISSVASAQEYRPYNQSEPQVQYQERPLYDYRQGQPGFRQGLQQGVEQSVNAGVTCGSSALLEGLITRLVTKASGARQVYYGNNTMQQCMNQQANQRLQDQSYARQRQMQAESYAQMQAMQEANYARQERQRREQLALQMAPQCQYTENNRQVTRTCRGSRFQDDWMAGWTKDAQQDVSSDPAR